jgi:hypothetical protein
MLVRLAALAALLSACAPTYVESSADVDVFIAQQRYAWACVALKNEGDDKLRQYTARKLKTFPDSADATQCLCDAVVKWPHGAYDVATLEGLKDAQRDDLAECVLPVLAEVKEAERVTFVRQLGDMKGKVAWDQMQELAGSATESPEVRAMAARGLLPDREARTAFFLTRLGVEPDPTVRAILAELLEGSTQPEAVAVLVKLATDDPDGGVRAAALKSVVKLQLPETDAMVCKLMMDDTDERVRTQAVKSYKATKRKEALDCLETRLKTRELSPMVRQATLDAVYSSPDPRAARILCDQIGPFLRMTVSDTPVHRMEGADIVKAQNNRDYENSFSCVQKALGQGGYSCWGRFYLATWMKELGGKAFVPTCEGEAPIIFEE